ncbi:unnamed protein product [Rotaria socialis]|uniref:Uncharacterized protein n=1 Tax=Rotaria socialis TaxID=392032 RepID=A0A818KX99_9BILA|nr:unnamed protein product [Rotaria socialis]
MFLSDAQIKLHDDYLRKQSNVCGNPMRLGAKILQINHCKHGLLVCDAKGVCSLICNKRVIKKFTGHDGPVSCCTSYGDLIVTGGWDKTIRIHSLESTLQVLHLHNDYVKSLLVHNNVLYSASTDRTIRRIIISESKVESTVLKGHTGAVTGLCWSSLLVSCSSDCTIRSWDKNNVILFWLMILVFMLFVPKMNTFLVLLLIILLSILPFDYILFTGSRDGNIRVFDWSSGKLVRIIEGHYDSVTGLLVINNELISSSLDGTIRSWPIANILNNTKFEVLLTQQEEDLLFE